MPSTQISQESCSSCSLITTTENQGGIVTSTTATISSFKSIVVEDDSVYTLQPTNLKPPVLDCDSWCGSGDDDQEQVHNQKQIVPGKEMNVITELESLTITIVNEAAVVSLQPQDDDDTASAISAATATTATSNATSSNVKVPAPRTGGLLIVEKDIAETPNQFERIVASLHVLVGVSHTGGVEFPAGGFDSDKDQESILRGAAREITEELKHSVLLHLPGPQQMQPIIVNEPSLPVIKSGIPSADQISRNNNQDDDDDTQHHHRHHDIAFAHSDEVYKTTSEQALASIRFKCNYGEGEANNREVTLFLCRYIASAASPFDLSNLRDMFQSTHVSVDDAIAWCEFKELKLIPIFAASPTTKIVASASDIQLSREFLQCCFPYENDRNCPNLADKRQKVLRQLFSWFVPSAAAPSSSDEVEHAPTASITKTQAKKLKNLQRENLRQAMIAPILSDSNLQIASSFLRFSVRPSHRPLQEREMCSFCYKRDSHSTAESICPFASRKYAYLQLLEARRCKNGAILLKWKIVPPPSASGSKIVIPNSNLFTKLSNFCRGNEWVHDSFKLPNKFSCLASKTPGGHDFFEQYVTAASEGDSNLPPVFAEGIPQVSEYLNEKKMCHGYNCWILVTKVFFPPAPTLLENNNSAGAAILPPPPRSQQRNNDIPARHQGQNNNNNNNHDHFNFRNAAATAASTTNTVREPPRFEDFEANQRRFAGANAYRRN